MTFINAQVPLWRSPLLTALGVNHGFTTRAGGVSVGRFATLNLGTTWGDDPAASSENLRRVAATAGFAAEALCTVVQVHEAQVVAVTKPERRAQQADGLVTAAPLPLGVLSADCVSLLLADGRGRVGAAHAGWRGTVADMAGSVVAALVELGARREELRAALCPSIGPCCFVVGADVAARFRAVLPDAVLPDAASGRSRVDLWAVNRALLQSAGLAAAHIDDSPPCTCCDAGSFFSYRRDGAGIGQHLAFILGGQP